MYNKLAVALVYLGFFVWVRQSSAQGDVYVSQLWNYTHFNSNCFDISMPSSYCEDIRICRSAAASLAMGGWPGICGWVENIVPKVCCGFPMVLGGALMKKIEEEKERHAYCGRATWATKLSQIQHDFFKILNYLPESDESDPSRFDPPLEIKPVKSGGGGYGGYSSFSMQFEFPWMASILKNRTHLCGGSLISRIHVLTAAHCFVSRSGFLDPRSIIVLTGDVSINNGYPSKVTKIILHEKFIPGQNYHDIAILTLEKEVPSLFHPICLPSPELSVRNFAGVNTTGLGWGHTSYGGRGTTKLQVANGIPVVSNEKCRRAYSKIGGSQLPRGITNDFICAGLEDGSIDACQGDSGGPLMYEHTDYDFPVGVPTERWVQLGIVSFGFRCLESGYPGVYTRVSSYMTWILQNIQD